MICGREQQFIRIMRSAVYLVCYRDSQDTIISIYVHHLFPHPVTSIQYVTFPLDRSMSLNILLLQSHLASTIHLSIDPEYEEF